MVEGTHVDDIELGDRRRALRPWEGHAIGARDAQFASACVDGAGLRSRSSRRNESPRTSSAASRSTAARAVAYGGAQHPTPPGPACSPLRNSSIERDVDSARKLTHADAPEVVPLHGLDAGDDDVGEGSYEGEAKYGLCP